LSYLTMEGSGGQRQTYFQKLLKTIFLVVVWACIVSTHLFKLCTVVNLHELYCIMCRLETYWISLYPECLFLIHLLLYLLK